MGGSPSPTPVICVDTMTGRCDIIGACNREGGPRFHCDGSMQWVGSRAVHDDRRMQSRGRSEVSLPRANAVPKAAALARAHARGTARSVSPRIVPPYCDPLYKKQSYVEM